MKAKKIIIVFFCICILTISACTTRTSDSGFSQKTLGKKIDSNIYVLNVTMLGERVSPDSTAIFTVSEIPDSGRTAKGWSPYM